VIRVLIADDHPLVRRGLRQVLEKEQGFEVVAQTDNGDDLVRRVGGLKPDVALIDIRMPPTFTDEAAAQLRSRRPETRVLLLSMYDTDQYVRAALHAGAAGGARAESRQEARTRAPPSTRFSRSGRWVAFGAGRGRVRRRSCRRGR